MPVEPKIAHLRLNVSMVVKSLIVKASQEHGEKRTGQKGKLTPWVTGVLVDAALKELGYSSLQEYMELKD